LLAIIADPDASLAYRIAAGEALARLGDPRFSGPYLLPEFVEIPAGEFWMGSERVSDDEKPVHRVHLEGFAIAKYPVTNAQYAIFVQATEREPPRHWEGGQVPPHLANHPVVTVTWHDAVAYCQWLSRETDQPYRLPTEAEWERAATGGLPSPSQGEGAGPALSEAEGVRVWPWGDEWDENKANTIEGGPGTTTPVGVYPAGASPEGVLDIAGNVWEWCNSLYRPYPYDPRDGRENLESKGTRALRGGSWYGDLNVARCACRYGGGPVGWGDGVGFRCARG
jgi:formylglycine-generating enzyme required for sulfatase activity